MTADSQGPGGDDLQFESAEPEGQKPAGPVCAVCQKPIPTYYYEANGQVVCSSCKQKVEASNVSGVAASGFLRATLFGFGAAVAGAAVYFGVRAISGYDLALISILVGFMVGYAVRLGAGGHGGRRYQFLALALTYLAIGSTFIPQAMQELSEGVAIPADSTPSLATQERGTTPTGGDQPAARDSASDTTSVKATQVSPVLALVVLVALAAALPVLATIAELPSSLIMGLIVGVALHQAWRMNARVIVTFTGPFKVGAAPAAGGIAGA